MAKRVLVAVAAVALSVSACGSSAAPSLAQITSPATPSALVVAAAYAKTPMRIIETQAAAAFNSMSSFHVEGVVPSAAGAQDMSMSLDGQGDCDLTFAWKGRGASAHLLDIGGTGYVDGNAAYWRMAGVADARTISRFQNRWISDVDLSVGGVACNFTKFMALFKGLSTNNTNAGSAKPSTLDGDPVVELTSPTGKDVAIVAATSPHYILKFEQQGGMWMQWTAINVAVNPTVPPDAATAAQVRASE